MFKELLGLILAGAFVAETADAQPPALRCVAERTHGHSAVAGSSKKEVEWDSRCTAGSATPAVPAMAMPCQTFTTSTKIWMSFREDDQFYRWTSRIEGEPVAGGERETNEALEVDRATGKFNAMRTMYDSYSGVDEYVAAYAEGHCAPE